MLTRITDRKTPCVCIHIYQIIKYWGLGPYNSLRHADSRKYFSGLSNAKSKGSAHVLLGGGSGKIWTCFCWEKGNFIMINEFKYDQTWKIWLSPLSLSLYSTFEVQFLIFLSARVKIHQIPQVNFELTSQFLFKFCTTLHCHDTKLPSKF